MMDVVVFEPRKNRNLTVRNCSLMAGAVVVAERSVLVEVVNTQANYSAEGVVEQAIVVDKNDLGNCCSWVACCMNCYF